MFIEDTKKIPRQAFHWNVLKKHLMSKTSFTELINSKEPVLIDFYADWCGPCRVQAPMLEELKKEMGARAKVVKIDVDRNEALASKLQIFSIPTLMIFQGGELKWRAMGVQTLPVLKQQLEALISEQAGIG